MENQHRKITGYRDLSENEVGLINHCKEMAEQVEDVLDMVESEHDIDGRSIELARDFLQTGFMWLVRAVAKPETF